ncbi:hypothetical protein TCAL_04697 [Tigriopus californicus]|uniref:Pickpocket protein 28 n=1 Tax=Tigriopus californicus TaxID=6832 RepID=A0A553NTK0_TIGCA|nr:amiloride-sensitive sodium channel subunit gamma-2-like [Tigriopus californicus]TRY68756.1 hypothetical protein TCAL_04697 [Tigriopus californicus]
MERSDEGFPVQQKIQENYLKVDVYYQTFNVRSVSEVPQYSGDSLFAALGGALSFYLGVAIVIGFELVELFVLVFASIWSHQTQSPKKSFMKNSDALENNRAILKAQ